MNRITQFESLRGLMAWWVVAAHLVSNSALTEEQSGLAVKLLKNGGMGVDVFMILSGFVITFLILRKPETYGRYLGRRFLRIFPLFAVCVTAAIALIPVELEAYRLLESRSSYLAQTAVRFRAGIGHPGLILPLKFSMLHGLVPEGWMTNVAGSYLGPGWSISTEWQFYLVAPFVVALARRWGNAHLLFLASVCLLFIVGKRFDNVAFIGRHAPSFYMGIVSCLFFQFLDRCDMGPVAVGRLRHVFVVGLAVGLFYGRSLPLLIWMLCMWAASMDRLGAEDHVSRLINGVLKNRLVNFLGRVSYSTYLVHLLVIYVGVAWLLKSHPDLSAQDLFWRLTIFTVPVTLVLSTVTYYCVEQPFVRLGQKWFPSR